ncbi:unnamed protein product [Psylliodes chrysocephalus]|uniref:Uncharacterized protein n=1 Tax=Psylliodes chrysocephalus TaxID=3402493 RepID=A0A9P0CHI5_9CUCU|nr:unnamed protein product [Psylliodes chrysocephala]
MITKIVKDQRIWWLGQIWRMGEETIAKNVLMTENNELTAILRQITLKDVIYWLSQASTIQKSWNNILIQDDDTEDDLPINHLAVRLRDAQDDSDCEDEMTLFDLMKQIKGCEDVTEQDVNQ